MKGKSVLQLSGRIEVSFSARVDGNPIQCTIIFENDTVSIIYFACQHSAHEVTIPGSVGSSGSWGAGGIAYMK